MEDPAIIKLNLRHYRALLQLDLDESKRHLIENLIAEAEAELLASEYLREAAQEL